MKTFIFAQIIFLFCCVSCSNREAKETTSTAADAAAPATTAKTESSDAPDAGDHDPQTTRKAAGQITAGEWRDVKHWDFWQSLMQQDIYGDMQNQWSFHLKDRISVKARTATGAPAADVPLKLLSSDGEVCWEGRTDNEGLVDLFPMQKNKQQAQQLKIVAGNVVREINEDHNEPITITIPAQTVKATLDAAFVVDATGSMGDEMDYLKAELTDVIQQVSDHNANLEIRTGSVFYRDEDDDFVTRKSGFTDDVSETVGFIRKQQAEGGGDFPEAVHTALDVALNELEWSEAAQARLLFLVLDAPPHEDPAIIGKVNRLVALAGKKGIRIIPVVSSGINKETEFLMRYMAIATGGTYVFLTDDSGIGNSHLQPTIGKYEVEYLNELLVRVIDRYVRRGLQQG